MIIKFITKLWKVSYESYLREMGRGRKWGKAKNSPKGEEKILLSSLCLQYLYIFQNTWSHVTKFITSSHKNQIINWNRSLQQRMFTCISIRSNYLAKHPSPVSAPQVHWRFKTITKLLVKFCIDKPSQYFIFCPSTYNKLLVPFYDLWLIVLQPLGMCSE